MATQTQKTGLLDGADLGSGDQLEHRRNGVHFGADNGIGAYGSEAFIEHEPSREGGRQQYQSLAVQFDHSQSFACSQWVAGRHDEDHLLVVQRFEP